MSGGQRLGKNHGGYGGERIDIVRVLQDDLRAARDFGWSLETLPAGTGREWIALHRRVPGAETKIYLSTGIHGDEPAGPLAVRQLLIENQWPANTDIWICPCLNPTGFPINQRENADGLDLNRDYRHPRSVEIRSHVDWLNRLPGFDLCFCLHEDWESHGFYLYELNPDRRPSPAERIIAQVSRICPIDPSAEIEGRPARGGIIRPDLDPAQRPQWPEAFFLITHKTRHSFTLEAPSDFPLSARVAALVAAVRTGFRAESTS